MHRPSLLPRGLRVRAFLAILVTLSLWLVPSLPARAAGIIFVVPGGASAQTGASWSDAKDLQAALTAATSGDQIWVKAGTYKPTTGTNRSATFQLKNGVALYGGFAGTESSLIQRDPTLNVTILSGDLLGNDSGAMSTSNPTR